MKKRLLVVICMLMLVLVSCGKKDTTSNETEKTVVDIENFLEENGLEEKYSDFTFVIDEFDNGCWLKTESYEFLVEDAIEIIELAESQDIGISMNIGSVWTIHGSYMPTGKEGEDWIVYGYGLGANGEEVGQLDGLVSTEEILEVYYEHKEDIPQRKVLEELMIGACKSVYEQDAVNRDSWMGEPFDHLEEYEFVKYYSMISELEPVEITEENTQGYYKEYFTEHYGEYVLPINYYVDGETQVFQYIQGDIIIYTQDWTSTVVCKDNSHLLNVEENELEQSVQSVYYSMTELQNGGQDVLFDNASLWTIANNWEELKDNPIAGQPVDCITYDDRIEFVYGNGLTLIWHYNEDIVDVVDTNLDYSDNSETDEFADTDNNAEYYLNSQGVLVDKVEEFETQTFGEYVVKYPILNDGVDEVVVYEFDTYDNIHVVLDASNVYQQISLDEMGDYGDVQLEQVAPGRDIAYMFDGERYYIEDYTINLLTISKPINDN